MYRKEAFERPDHRKGPLQIAHDFQFVALNIKSDYAFSEEMSEQEKRAHIAGRLDRLRERGYAGVVLSADNKGYLEDEEALERMAWAVDYAHEKGMRVWLYDEQYYPSGSAGGLTLKEHPELESMALACVEKDVKVSGVPVRVFSPMGHSPLKYAFAEDEAGRRQDISRWTDPAGNLCWDAPNGKWHVWCFFLRPQYEGSYLALSFRASRRYPNICDEQAMARFLDVTYGAYERALGDRLGKKIEAVFTDEPSQMVYRPYPADRDPDADRTQFPSVSIYDRPQIDMPIYPYLPWPQGIEEAFSEKCGYSLPDKLPELFSRDFERTGKFRRNYFETMGLMFDRAFSGQYRKLLKHYPMKYSGHWILEEQFSRHPFMYGDILHQLGQMDIPGCDLLHSTPDILRHSVACKLASSAAHQYGRKHVMIEASNMCDEDQSFSVERIELAMAMLHALGVDTITSYYGEELFDEAGYRRFAAYTARLGQVLEGGVHVSEALLYYPYEQLASLGAVGAQEDAPGALALEKEIIALSDRLLAAQADYDFINREVLLGCRCEGGRIITPCGETPASLIFPPVDFVDTEVAQVIRQAVSAGVQVIMGGERREICGLADLSGVRFEAEEGLVCGSDLVVENEPQLTFMHRSFGMQQVYLMVNTGEEEICKKASIPDNGRNLLLLDPDSGEEKALSCEIRDGRVWFDLNIPSGSARILVQS